MEMTIDEIEFALNSIKIVLEHTEKGYYPEQFKTHEECLKEVMDIVRKYQHITKIVEAWESDVDIDSYDCMSDIREVIEDANNKQAN